MIIYGYKHRTVEMGAGQFYCTHCGTQRDYRHMNIVRMFTLFFIPLFPLGTVQSYIECQVCKTGYEPADIASHPENQQLAADLEARQAETNRQRKARGGRNLLVLGAVIASISLRMLAILTVFQLTYSDDPFEGLFGTFLLAAICPLPLLAAGVASLLWGTRIRRSVSEAPL